jgi:hypothetical protein
VQVDQQGSGLANSKWQLAAIGKWQMADGKWQMAIGHQLRIPQDSVD